MLHGIIHTLLFSTAFIAAIIHTPTTNLGNEIYMPQYYLSQNEFEPIIPEAENYTEEEFLLLAKLIDCEASDICTDEHKMWVGQVVLNRVKNNRFPNDLKGTIYQKDPIQYACAYNGVLEKNIPSERSKQAARKLLNGTKVCSEEVIWQSEFKQGEVIKKFDVYINGRLYSRTYFCK